MRQAFHLVWGLIMGAGMGLPLTAHVDVPATTPCKMEAKVIELPKAHTSLAGFLSENDFKNLVNEKDVSILSTPSLKLKAAEPGQIGIDRDFKLPDGTTRLVGITLKVTPQVKSNSISAWHIQYENARFIGYTDTTAKKQPVFQVQTVSIRESDSSLRLHGLFHAFDLPPPVYSSQQPLYDASGKLISKVDPESKKRQALLIRISRA